MVVPTDLAVGAQYRLVFVTAGPWDATSTNIDDYNTFVTNEARGGTAAIDTALDTALNAAGFDPNTITWKAIGSTAAVDARDNTGTNPGTSTGVPIYLIDGNRVANDNADLWDGSLITFINKTQLDTIYPWNYVGSSNFLGGTSLVFTGTTTDGSAAPMVRIHGRGPAHLGSPRVRAGTAESWDIPWIGAEDTRGDTLLGFYAMSGVLTVPGNQPPEPVTVPEPTSLLGYITLGCLMLGGAVRKARK